MQLSQVVSFRKDLLFHGAVQINWLETDPEQAKKAAQHYVFHGPDYHGVGQDDFLGSSHQLVDTASFVKDILERLVGGFTDRCLSRKLSPFL